MSKIAKMYLVMMAMAGVFGFGVGVAGAAKKGRSTASPQIKTPFCPDGSQVVCTLGPPPVCSCQ